MTENLPDAFSAEAYTPAVRRLYERSLGRAPSDDEANAAIADMTACGAEGGNAGCGGSGHAALRWFCARLLDSAEFAVY